MSEQQMERKAIPAFDVKVLDEEQGICEELIAVFGILDDGKDVLHPNSWRKTIVERGHRIRVVDQHKTDSISCVLGKPVSIREVSRMELPEAVQREYPEATGGVVATTQYLMDTPEGKGAFIRRKTGAVPESSFGYTPIQHDYSKVKDRSGNEVVARNLREVKVFEYGPVLWGMNPATVTISAKGAGEQPANPDPPDPAPPEAKEQPEAATLEAPGVEPDEVRTGAGGLFTEQELRDAYARHYGDRDPADVIREILEQQEEAAPDGAKAAPTKAETDGEHPAAHYLVVENPFKPATWHLRCRGMDGKPDHGLMGAAWAALHGGHRGNRYEGPDRDEALAKLKRLYESEGMDTPKAGDGPEDAKEMTPEGPVRRLGDVLQGRIHAIFTGLADTWYTAGLLNREERIHLSSLIGDALDVLATGIPADVASRRVDRGYGYEMMGGDGPDETKAGRVLAARNADRVRRLKACAEDHRKAYEAMSAALAELMDDAGLDEPDEPDETNESEETSGAAPDEKAAAPEQKTEQAGPPTAPTSGGLSDTEIKRRLALIELYQAQTTEV